MDKKNTRQTRNTKIQHIIGGLFAEYIRKDSSAEEKKPKQ